MSIKKWADMTREERLISLAEAEERDKKRIEELVDFGKDLVEIFNNNLKGLYKRKSLPICIGRMVDRPPYYAPPNPRVNSNILEKSRSPEGADEELEKTKRQLKTSMEDRLIREKAFLQCCTCDRQIFDRCAILSGKYQSSYREE
jgi:hypothetical protein